MTTLKTMLLPFGLIAVALTAQPSAKESRAMHHATGTFEVKITPEAQGDAPNGGVPTARMGIHKVFVGGFVGIANGTMLSAGTPKAGSAAAYVAIDQFTGALDGKQGGFMLVHRGTMSKVGDSDLSVIIAPDSGTGLLEGISGSFTIKIKDGKHFYDIAYHLPAQP
jgi:hypothetical protein